MPQSPRTCACLYVCVCIFTCVCACVFTWVNKVVFCPEMTFKVCCPCVEDVLTPSVPWTTDPVVSCFPDVWGDGWPTKNVP